ncbi:MAG TPA: YidC/Oxa1 family membrane protein insertase [Haloplasmataceae bacterium]
MKSTSKKKYLLLGVVVLSLFVLSGCRVMDKEGNFLEIKPGGLRWDTFVYPIAWFVDRLTKWTNSYALGIILITLIIRTVLFPVYTKSNETTMKMQEIQPEIQKIQQKYMNRTDPESKSKMNMELMQLYQKHNINLFAGCLMPILQMPIFFAMYHAVARTPATFEGYADEIMKFLWTRLDAIAMTGGLNSLFNEPLLLILPVLVLATTIFQQWLSTIGMSKEARDANPSLKIMMYFIPVMLFSFALTSVQALSLYFLMGNIISIVQYIVVKKPFKKKELR